MAAKKKSTVNKAGNYTKPTMRKNLFNKIKAGTKGGKAGQWSARKAQLVAKKYKAAGGGYRDYEECRDSMVEAIPAMVEFLRQNLSR